MEKLEENEVWNTLSYSYNQSSGVLSSTEVIDGKGGCLIRTSTLVCKNPIGPPHAASEALAYMPGECFESLKSAALRRKGG